MKKLILVLFLAIAISLSPASAVAKDTIDSPCYYKETNEACVWRLVKFYAKKYGVSSSKMMQTLKNENKTFQFHKQSELRYKKGNRWKFPEGTREKSFGIAQIHLPDHPDVSYQEATDPAFAVEFMAKAFAKGKQGWWMGYPKS